MDKLTKSPRLNTLLRQMGIYSFYDVVYHLPRRYDNYNLTKDYDLEDKQRVVLLGDVISLPKLNKGSRASLITFDFMDVNKKFFRVMAYNRPYLLKTLNINERYTIIGSYDKKRNEIDLINLTKGEIEKDKALKPVYSLPSDYPNHLFDSLVKRP